MEILLRFQLPNTNFLIDFKTFFTFVALVLTVIAAFVTKWRSSSVSTLFKGKSLIPHPSHSFSDDYDYSDEESYSSYDDDSDDGEDSEEEEEDESLEPQGQDGNYDYVDGLDWTGRSSVVKLWEGTRKELIQVEDWDSGGEREAASYLVGDLRNVGSTLGKTWRRSDCVVTAADDDWLWGSKAAMRLMLSPVRTPVRKM